MVTASPEFVTTARLSPLGPVATGFGENAAASLDSFTATEQAMSRQAGLFEAYQDYLHQVEIDTGKRLPNPFSFGVRERPRMIRKIDSQLRQLADEQPDFKPKFFADLETESRAAAVTAARGQAAVAARQNAAGAFGEFAGNVVGAITDPVVMFTLPFGASAASGVLRTGVIEGLIAGGTEIAIQPIVQQFRKELGLPSGFGQAATNIAAAAVGGGVLGAGFKLLSLGTRRLLGIADQVITQPTPAQRDAANVLRREIEIEDAAPDPEPTLKTVARHRRDFDTALDHAVAGRPVPEGDIPARRLPAEPPPVERAPISEAAREAAAELPEPSARPSRPDAERGAPPAREGAEDVAPGLTDMLTNLRSGKRPTVQTLLPFLRSSGGLRIDDTARAELAALGVTPRTLPGLLNNRAGLNLDDAALRATEAGFFPGKERATINDLLDAIGAEIQGRPLVRGADQVVIAERAALAELDEVMSRLGIGLELPDSEIQRLLVAHGKGAEELLVRGGPDVARVLDDIDRETAAMQAADVLDDVAADTQGTALMVDLEQVLQREPDLRVPVGIERDPATGELIPIMARVRDVLADLDADDAFNRELRECVT